METLIDHFKSYGYETFFIAILINLLTTMFKTPIKRLALKLSDETIITKYITILPVIIGLALCLLYKYILMSESAINDDFITLWLSSSSLSLANYAVFEKFFPSKQKLLNENKYKENMELLEQLTNLKEGRSSTIESVIRAITHVVENLEFGDMSDKSDVNSTTQKSDVNGADNRIILRGNPNVRPD